jgi:hypothetical protein
MASSKQPPEIAIPKYTRVGRDQDGSQCAFVDVSEVMKVMKLQKRADRANEDICLLVVRDTDEKKILKQLKTVFQYDAAVMQRVTKELSNLVYNIQTLDDDQRPVTTVTLAERRKMCEEMTPRLVSIAAHARAARLEYEQLWADYELGRIVFSAEYLWFHPWNSHNFDAEEFPSHMKEYLEELGGEYDEEPPSQSTKKAKCDNE